ncbi:MAG: response regulator transcription factor [Sphingomonadaceae bacterium]
MPQLPTPESAGHRPTLLVDDQAAFRQLARSLLEGRYGIVVVGEASSGEEALEMVPLLHPKVVILDVQLPGMNGFEAAWRMMEMAPELQVVVVSAYDFQYTALAESVGAAGFVSKRHLSAEGVARLLGIQ